MQMSPAASMGLEVKGHEPGNRNHVVVHEDEQVAPCDLGTRM